MPTQASYPLQIEELAMARKSLRSPGRPPKTRPESSEESEPGTPASITKVGAVRAALEEGSGLPEQGVAFIKSRFGLDITRQHFSAIKSQLKKREGAPRMSRPGRKPRRPAAVRSTAPPVRFANGEAGLLEALEVIKPLVAQLGADKVKRLVELLD